MVFKKVLQLVTDRHTDKVMHRGAPLLKTVSITNLNVHYKLYKGRS